MARSKCSNPVKSRDELLELIGLSLIDDIAQELQSDKWVIKLKLGVIFKLVLSSLIDCERISLQVMETHYNSPQFKTMEASAIGKTSHSSLRNRLVSIDVRFFERIYCQSMKIPSSQYDKKQLNDYNIKRYDSTMIAVNCYQRLKHFFSDKNQQDSLLILPNA